MVSSITRSITLAPVKGDTLYLPSGTILVVSAAGDDYVAITTRQGVGTLPTRVHRMIWRELATSARIRVDAFGRRETPAWPSVVFRALSVVGVITVIFALALRLGV